MAHCTSKPKLSCSGKKSECWEACMCSPSLALGTSCLSSRIPLLRTDWPGCLRGDKRSTQMEVSQPKSLASADKGGVGMGSPAAGTFCAFGLSLLHPLSLGGQCNPGGSSLCAFTSS